MRLDTELVRRLEKRARADRANLSEKIRELLEDGLEDKPEPSLADFRADWLRRLRDTIEHAARKDPEAAKNIETDWRCLQILDGMFANFYAEVETRLDSYLPNPRVRELLRGTPTPLESKAAQQE